MQRITIAIEVPDGTGEDFVRALASDLAYIIARTAPELDRPGDVIPMRRRDCEQLPLDLDLPIPSAPARPTDPETSHAAAETEPDIRRFSGATRQAHLLRILTVTPMTAQRAAVIAVGPTAPVSRVEGCRRRMSDLYRAGFIADSGRRELNPGSDEESIVWEVTEAGIDALRRIEETGWSR